MFICNSCINPIGPGISPVLVVIGARPVEYLNAVVNVDDFGRETKREIHSTGFEILGEVKTCPTCAGEEEANIRSSVEVFGGKTFEEKAAAPLKVKLIALALDKALDRVEQSSKRSSADAEASFGIMKQFIDDNPGIVF